MYKKVIWFLTTVFFVVFATQALAVTFSDVPANATYAEAVNSLADYGILTGDEQGRFNPDKTITRAEMAAVVCRMLGIENNAKESTNAGFTDVPSTHWAVGYIATVNEMGIVNGYGNGKFGPSDPVTCEQVIKMLVSAWGYDDEAQGAGGYPNGFISVANDLGVTKNVTFNQTAASPRSIVAVFAYNTLAVNPSVEG